MPAEIERAFLTDNKPAWWGVDVMIPESHATSTQILEAIPELNSMVLPAPMLAVLPDGSQIAVPNQVANVRVYGQKVLGVVGQRYKILQNRDAFTFMDTLIDSGEASYKSAGSLYEGRVVWMLAELPGDVTLAGMDSEKANRFLLLKNSHDGSSAVEVAVTLVRVVCSNTLSLALSTSPRMFKVRHTTNMYGKIQAAREALQMEYAYTSELDELADQLVHTPFSEMEFNKFLESLVPTKDKNGKDKEGRGLTVAENTQSEIRGLYNGAANLKPIKDTAWGALNAVIEYHDHGITSRETQQSTADENRFERITNPLPGAIHNRAQKYVMDFAGIA